MTKQVLINKVLFCVALNVSLMAFAQTERPNREAFRKAMDECRTAAQAAGITVPERRGGGGERPSEEARQYMDTCMADKGFERPERPPEGGRRHHFQQQKESESGGEGVQ